MFFHHYIFKLDIFEKEINRKMGHILPHSNFEGVKMKDMISFDQLPKYDLY